MSPRVLLGGFLAFLYNDLLSKVPSRHLRHRYLSHWLGGLRKGVSVDMHCRFLNGRKVFLGERTIVNFGTLLDGRTYTIRTGRDVSIGPCATLLTLGHDPHSPEFEDRGGSVVVEDYAWIGYGAVICPGVTIGTGAVVGAGSVVTRSVEPWTVVAGNPARKVSDRRIEPNYRLFYRPLFL